MPVFPPCVTLIMDPTNWYSKGKTASHISGGEYHSTNYPLSALTDGSGSDGAFRFQSVNGSVQINLNTGNTVTPNVFAVFGHNLDPGMVVTVQANTSPSFSGGVPLSRGVGVKKPGFWLDLRGFPIQADYWRFNFAHNSKPVRIGEIVIGYAASFSGMLEPGFAEEIGSYHERGELEYGRIIVEGPGILHRKLGLSLELSVAGRTALDAISDSAGASGSRVVVIPDTNENNAYLMEWPSKVEFRFPKSLLVARTSLDLVEEVFGVY